MAHDKLITDTRQNFICENNFYMKAVRTQLSAFGKQLQIFPC